jgi:hypothetical protein
MKTGRFINKNSQRGKCRECYGKKKYRFNKRI